MSAWLRGHRRCSRPSVTHGSRSGGGKDKMQLCTEEEDLDLGAREEELDLVATAGGARVGGSRESESNGRS